MHYLARVCTFVALVTAIAAVPPAVQKVRTKFSDSETRVLSAHLGHQERAMTLEGLAESLEAGEEMLKDFQYLIAPGLASKNEKCRKHSELYMQQFISKKPEMWAFQMLDSSGTFPPSGLLYGNLQSVGQYEECLALEFVPEPENGEKVAGRHCVTYLYISEEKNLNKEKSNRDGGNSTLPPDVQVALGYLAQGKIHRGVCVPSSCSYEDVMEGTNLFLRHVHLVTKLDEKHCDAKGELRELSGADIAVLTILSFIIIIVLLSTAIDVLYQHKQKKVKKMIETTEAITGQKQQPGVMMKLIGSFSVVANLRKIFTVKKGELDVLHGLRFFSMTWVILGHSYVMVVTVPLQNAEFVLRASKQWIMQMVFNAYVSVDTFFFMSGFLVAYVFFRTMRKPKNVISVVLLVLKGYVYRYLRLTPVYAIVIAMAATIYYHFGNGPYWKTTSSLLIGVCQDKWWTNLLYVNNFVLGDNDGWCIGQGWYLAVDMQFFLIAPIVTVPLLFRKRLGLLWLAFLTCWSIIIPAVTIYINDAPPGVPAFSAQAMKYPTFLQDWYAMPWNRFSPYILGLLCGYLYINKPKRRLLNLPIALVGWFLAVGIGMAVVFGMYDHFQLDGTYSMGVATMYGCLHRVAWSVCIAWIIFACTQGYGGPVNSILSWSAFVPLSRMSYCSYLVAMHVQYWFTSTRTVPPYYDHPYMMYNFFGHVIVTHLLATLFSICFESPCIGLTKLIMEGSRRPPPPKQVVERSSSKIEDGIVRPTSDVISNQANGNVNAAYEGEGRDTGR